MTGISIKNAFNQAIKTYDQFCQPQIEIANQLIQLIKQYAKNYHSILDLGCGTGIITQELDQHLQFKRLYAVDIAESLLMKAKQRLAHLNIQINEADFDQPLPFNESFDLIFSNMALHWSKQFTSLLQSLLALLSTNGLLAFSIPLSDTFKELSQHYSLNQFYDYTLLNSLLLEYHYKIVCTHEEKKILYFSNTQSALQAIQKIGASYVNTRKYRGLRGKNFLTQAKITQLTYHIGYFLLQPLTRVSK